MRKVKVGRRNWCVQLFGRNYVYMGSTSLRREREMGHVMNNPFTIYKESRRAPS